MDGIVPLNEAHSREMRLKIATFAYELIAMDLSNTHIYFHEQSINVKVHLYNEFNTDIQKMYKDAFTGCMREGMPNAENQDVPVYLGFWMDRSQLSSTLENLDLNLFGMFVQSVTINFKDTLLMESEDYDTVSLIF